MTPKVSICIPTYKQVDYLRKTLQSVVDQTFTDYEVVITDDSPDDSVEQLLKEFRFGNKLQYVKNAEPLGSPENWNAAIRLAKGDYIKILHHDDWFSRKTSLAKFVQLLDDFPEADFGFSATEIWRVGARKPNIHCATDQQRQLLREQPEILFCGNFLGAPSTTIYRRTVKELFDPKIKWVVDIEFYVRVLKKHPVFAFTDAPLIGNIHGASHQVTQDFIYQKERELGEYIYWFNRLDQSIVTTAPYRKAWARLFGLYGVASFADLATIATGEFKPKQFFNDAISDAANLPAKTSSSLISSLLRRLGLVHDAPVGYSEYFSPVSSCQLADLPKDTSEFFIFTEVYRCGKIGRIAIESFLRHHKKEKIHVFGTPEDFLWLPRDERVVCVDLTANPSILEGFNAGHRGTALLWAHLIKQRPERFLLHFDSDVIFRQSALADLTEPLSKGTDLIGYRRNYVHNPNNRDDVRHLTDLCQTAFFGFNRQKVGDYDEALLAKMCQGTYNPYGHPVIDFFDPVMFDILHHDGKIDHLSVDDYGGCDIKGKRTTNPYPELNTLIDFGHKFIHFSAVGSGMNFYTNRNKIRRVPQSYQNYAIDKYALYCKLFYSEVLDWPVDAKTYRALVQAVRPEGRS